EERLPGGRRRDQAGPAVARVGHAADQPGRLEGGDLPADRGQVDAEVVGERRQPRRSAAPDAAQQLVGGALQRAVATVQVQAAVPALGAPEEEAELAHQGAVLVLVLRGHGTKILGWYKHPQPHAVRESPRTYP